MANFVLGKCDISSAARISFGRRATPRRSIWPRELIAILIGFAPKATCAITSARLPKVCATKASYIGSGHHEARGNYPGAHQARWLWVGDWAGLRSDRAEKAGLSRSRARPLRQEGADRKISAAWNKYRKHRGGRFRLGRSALCRTHWSPARLRLDHRVARA